MIYLIHNSGLYDTHNKRIAVIRNAGIYNGDNKRVATMRGNCLFDSDNRKMMAIRGEHIYDAKGNCVGSFPDVQKMIKGAEEGMHAAAFWYCFIR
ncbi:MAG: hypothetical protein JXA06_11650 [Bacteroidetes bacterium]|nr:hypothetical protein [Bacteroidota bacterium]